MKLRIKGNSMRLRITRTELKRLLEEHLLEETIHFGAAPDQQLTYALEVDSGTESPAADVSLRYTPGRVAAVLSPASAQHWARAEDLVGLYGRCGVVDLAIEKDFACIDRNDPADADAFPNPKAAEGVQC